MKKEGLKLVYQWDKIIGLRNSIKYEIGDLVWVYRIDESYRNENKDIQFDKKLAKIIKVSESPDGLHFEQYAVEYAKTGNYGAWFYPTFLKPYKYKQSK
jgi:hypothetical protein